MTEREITRNQFLTFASGDDLLHGVITIGDARISVFYAPDGREVLRHYFPYDPKGVHRYTEISLDDQAKPNQGPLLGPACGG